MTGPNSWLPAGTWSTSSGTVYFGGITPNSKPGYGKQFVGFDFTMGEVHGLRIWKIDPLGRLRARNWDQAPPWRPGINVAQCLAPDASPRTVKWEDILDPTGKGRVVVKLVDHRKVPGSQGFVNWVEAFNEHHKRFSIEWSDGSTGQYDLSDLKFIKPPHDSPVEDCKCGFYAYTDTDHEELDADIYHDSNDYVLGIVKGTGRTLIGTRGFRCERAEIVALRDPTRGGKKTSGWRTAQRNKIVRVYPDVPLLPTRSALLEFADLQPAQPDPTSDDFWSLP